MYKGRVVDSNQFCLDPNPGLSVHSDPILDPAQDPNRIRILTQSNSTQRQNLIFTAIKARLIRRVQLEAAPALCFFIPLTDFAVLGGNGNIRNKRRSPN